MMIDYSVVLYFILGGYLLVGIAGLVAGVLLLRLALRWGVRGIKGLSAQACRPANTKEKTMRTDVRTIRARTTAAARPGLGEMRTWARRAISRERIAEAGLVTTTLILTGYTGAVLYHVTHTQWIR